jgi:hypothetical protein
MTDQPTQADRERALAVATTCLDSNVRITYEGSRIVSRVLLAIHAENERLRSRISEARRLVTGRPQLWTASIQAVLDGYRDEHLAQEPKMTETQAETGPSDEELRDTYLLASGGSAMIENHAEGLRVVWDAGRASLEGELARVNVAWSNQAHKADSERMQLRAELEAEKVKLSKSQAAYDQLQRRLTDVLAEMRTEAAARQARVMPSYVAIYEALRLCSDSGRLMPWQLHRLTDAVLRLLAPMQDSGPVGSADAIVPAVAATGSSPEAAAQPTGAGSDPPVIHGQRSGKRLAVGNPPVRPDAYYIRAQQARYVPSVGERAPESDVAWLKRTAEELTTAAVEVYEDPDVPGLCIRKGAGRAFGAIRYHEARDREGLANALREFDWPMRPVEPAAGVASPPRRFATPAEALACLRETIAEECHQEHPAHDAIGALETIEALSKRVAELELQRRVDAVLMDELADEGFSLFAMSINMRARIERDERAKNA